MCKVVKAKHQIYKYFLIIIPDFLKVPRGVIWKHTGRGRPKPPNSPNYAKLRLIFWEGRAYLRGFIGDILSLWWIAISFQINGFISNNFFSWSGAGTTKRWFRWQHQMFFSLRDSCTWCLSRKGVTNIYRDSGSEKTSGAVSGTCRQ